MHRCDLGFVADLWCGFRAVGINLGRGREACASDACAQTQLRGRVVDHSMLGRVRSDDLTHVVGRRYVCDPFDAGDDRGLEVGLSVFAVANRVEPVGYQSWFEGMAVTGGECGSELRFVAVGCLVKIDVHQEVDPEVADQLHHRSRFFGRTVDEERAIGIEAVGIPPVDHLVAPRTDTRCDKQIHAVAIGRGSRLQE